MMRKRVLLIVGLLVLGCLVNLIIAHACYLFSYSREQMTLDPAEAKRLFLVRSPSATTGEFSGSLSRGVGWTLWSYSRQRDPADRMSTETWNHAHVGFPLLAFQGDGWLLFGSTETASAWDNLSSTSATKTLAILEILFWFPRWPQFVISTLLYCALVGALLVGPGRMRRWSRMRRGLCARCAYPVGGSAVCTECGAARHLRKPRALACAPSTTSQRSAP